MGDHEGSPLRWIPNNYALRIMHFELNKDSPYVGFHNNSALRIMHYELCIMNSALRIMHYELRIKHYYVQKHLFLLTILVKS